MGIFQGLDISASGLMAQRLRLDVTSANLANIHTTRTAEGGPYKRKDVVFEEKTRSFADVLESMGGVQVSEIVTDDGEPKKVYEPGHPDADKGGYVYYPNVNQVEEMVNMLSATRSYEANITAIESYKSMFQRALDIGR